MIIDIFENIRKYESLNKNFKIAFDYILNTDFSLLSIGKYEILNNDVYASVDEYETKTVSRPEYHKKYIDIQFLIEGEEFIGYCKKNDLYNLEKFDEQKDIGFADGRVDLIKMDKSRWNKKTKQTCRKRKVRSLWTMC